MTISKSRHYIVTYCTRDSKKRARVAQLAKDFAAIPYNSLLVVDLKAQELSIFTQRLDSILSSSRDYYTIIPLCNHCIQNLGKKYPDLIVDKLSTQNFPEIVD